MKFPVLISYAYATGNAERFERLANNPNVQLLLDCGAFTAKSVGKEIKLDDYCMFLDKYGDRIFRYLALDVVGDPAGTEVNLKQMLKAGYKPVPVHVLGDDKRKMDELFEVSDYVALAGLRRPGKMHAPKDYLVAKMKWAAGRNVHWLGYVREDMISYLRPFSVDSASWSSAAIYGQLHLYMGQGRWVNSVRYNVNPEKLLENARAMEFVKQMGFTREQMLSPDAWRNVKGDNKNLAQYITCDSWVRYSIDIMKRYQTKIFLATGLALLDLLLDAIDRHADKLHLDIASVSRVPSVGQST